MFSVEKATDFRNSELVEVTVLLYELECITCNRGSQWLTGNLVLDILGYVVGYVRNK